MSDAETINHAAGPGVFSQNNNFEEARLEAAESHKYLMAKTYFDCREYDRCAAVFLPMTLPRGELSDSWIPSKAKMSRMPSKDKAAGNGGLPSAEEAQAMESLPRLSQKSLFLALYAKYMSGEKRKDEESEMILGPADGGVTSNKELVGIGPFLRERFAAPDVSEYGQGWLEYLYGICLAKSKAPDEAREWLIASVNHYPYNWGAWEELGSLIGSKEEV